MYDYTNYTVEDLARDAYFRNAILNPDTESTAFWQSWIAAGPDHRERYEKARLMVIALEQRYHAALPQAEVGHRVGQLIGKLDELESTPKKVKSLRINYWWRIAAAAAVVCLGFVWWSSRDTSKSLLRGHGSAQVAQASYQLVAKHNNTRHNQTLILSDSSIVTLFPGSTLQFPEKFAGDSRKVTLTGDAFFEISRLAKPFLVYAGETVTRVLGTRFRVTAFPDASQVKVTVKSGKVSVHRSGEFDLPKTVEGDQPPGIALVAHEQVVFNRANLALEKAYLTDMSLVAPKTDSLEQVFVDTPVTDVFKELESIYGIDIRFDKNVFANCHIITSFKSETTLIDRINSICEAIDANYEPASGGILISGSGCPGSAP